MAQDDTKKPDGKPISHTAAHYLDAPVAYTPYKPGKMRMNADTGSDTDLPTPRLDAAIDRIVAEGGKFDTASSLPLLSGRATGSHIRVFPPRERLASAPAFTAGANAGLGGYPLDGMKDMHARFAQLDLRGADKGEKLAFSSVSSIEPVAIIGAASSRNPHIMPIPHGQPVASAKQYVAVILDALDKSLPDRGSAQQQEAFFAQSPATQAAEFEKAKVSAEFRDVIRDVLAHGNGNSISK